MLNYKSNTPSARRLKWVALIALVAFMGYQFYARFYGASNHYMFLLFPTYFIVILIRQLLNTNDNYETSATRRQQKTDP